jgi:hypothetical protein
LTQINSRWRAIALSNPSLWTQIVTNFGLEHISGGQFRKPGCSLSLVEAQLERSGSQRLKIHICGNSWVDIYQIPIFQLLAQYSPCWEELGVGLTKPLVPLLASLCHRLLSLQRLWIVWPHQENKLQSDYFETANSFQTADSLVDVTIHNMFHRPIQLPFGQLTRYQLGCSFEEHMHILKWTPGLIETRIDISDLPFL